MGKARVGGRMNFWRGPSSRTFAVISGRAGSLSMGCSSVALSRSSRPQPLPSRSRGRRDTTQSSTRWRLGWVAYTWRLECSGSSTTACLWTETEPCLIRTPAPAAGPLEGLMAGLSARTADGLCELRVRTRFLRRGFRHGRTAGRVSRRPSCSRIAAGRTSSA